MASKSAAAPKRELAVIEPAEPSTVGKAPQPAWMLYRTIGADLKSRGYRVKYDTGHPTTLSQEAPSLVFRHGGDPSAPPRYPNADYIQHEMDPNNPWDVNAARQALASGLGPAGGVGPAGAGAPTGTPVAEPGIENRTNGAPLP